MHREIIVDRGRRSGDSATERWARLICEDEAGIDGDIEELIRVCRAKHAYSRDEANAALVRRFSWLGDGLSSLAREASS